MHSPPMDNRCSTANCGDSQMMHAPPVYCNYQQVNQFPNQQTGYKCSQTCDASSTMQPHCHQIQPNYNMHHQHPPPNPPCFHQYHQCVNCGAGQNLPQNHCFANVQSRNTPQFISNNQVAQCMQQPPISSNLVDNFALKRLFYLKLKKLTLKSNLMLYLKQRQ
ncbi:transcriptional activator cubitus interruptus [Caerostris extrusa]|uniref:Transcriptional activator cubitus interruptus n=1 Tax=Caerostris extrusa TaxID=172846 RepID=A0AAV4YBH3_CAEEX|nr:transcriptional activator cubitus interruptus [Caerostris extrusa]